MNSSRLSFTIVLIAIATTAASSPIDEKFYGLEPTVRIAQFRDVAHRFQSGYKSSPECPTEVHILAAPTIERNIGRVKVTDIIEDGNICSATGDGTFKIVSEATVKQGELIRLLGFPKAFAGLKSNMPARATIQNNKADSSLLVGFDEGERTCGNNVYADDSFWFFIREPQKFRIVIRGNQEVVNITLPENTRAMFLASPSKLCLLYDKSTSNGQKLIVSKTPSNKSRNLTVDGPRAPLVPFPSSSPLPASEPALNPPSSSNFHPISGSPNLGTSYCLPEFLRRYLPNFPCSLFYPRGNMN